MKFFKSFLFAYTRFFVIGLAVFVALGSSALIYVNNVYLKDSTDYQVKTIVTTSSSNVELKKTDIDEGAQNVTASVDRRYVAYSKDGVITVVDLMTGEKSKLDNPSKMSLSAFRWVYNRDWLAIAEKNTSGDYVKLYSCSMKDKKLNEVRDNVADVDIKIDLSSETDSVSAIEMSTGAVKTYLKITVQNKRSKIFEVDAYGALRLESKSNTVSSNIGNIQCLKDVDKLLYEDTDNGKLYLYGNKTAISVDGVTSLSILGFDIVNGEDHVYLANNAGGVTRTIYRGNYDGDTGKWTWSTPIKLDKAVSSSNIYVQPNGDIYYNDTENFAIVKAQVDSDTVSGSSSQSSAYVSSSKTSSSGSSSKATSSKSTSSKSSGSASSKTTVNGTVYTGKIIGVFQSGFLALDDNQIIPYDFKSSK